MSTRDPLWLAALGALAGTAGVIAAAAGAHATADPLMATVAMFLLVHAAALLGVAALVRSGPPYAGAMLAAGWVMAAALMLFCGDLAVRTLSGARLFPFAAPIGGTGLILGWLALTIMLLGAAFKNRTTLPR